MGLDARIPYEAFKGVNTMHIVALFLIALFFFVIVLMGAIYLVSMYFDRKGVKYPWHGWKIKKEKK